MRITVADAHGIPDEAYLSFRCGDVRRQRRFKVGEAFDFEDAVGTHRHLVVDVFEKVASKLVSLGNLQGVCSEGLQAGDEAADVPVSRIDLPRIDGAKMHLDIKVVGAAVDPGRRAPRHRTVLKAKGYLDKFPVQQTLQDMLQELLAEEPEEPLGYMVRYLQEQRQRRARGNPEASASTRDALCRPTPAEFPGAPGGSGGGGPVGGGGARSGAPPADAGEISVVHAAAADAKDLDPPQPAAAPPAELAAAAAGSPEAPAPAAAPPPKKAAPPGKAPPPKKAPPPGKAPPAKAPGKAPPPAAAKAAAPPLAAASLDEQRARLRRVAPAETAVGPRWSAGTTRARLEAEAREKRALAEDLRSLAAGTPLGVVAPAAVVAESAATELLGRGRFASVARASVVAVAGGVPQPSADEAGGDALVAAKRFAVRPGPAVPSGGAASADPGEPAAEGEEVDFLANVPVAALRAAKREAEALDVIGRHPNVVRLLGIVLPPSASAPPPVLPKAAAGAAEVVLPPLPPSSDRPASAEVSADTVPLQLLLARSEGCLHGLLSDKAAWAALDRRSQASLLADVARGLLAVHRAGFAHLDVKSHNVLVDPGADNGGSPPRALLCDFGTAFRVPPGGGGGEGGEGASAPPEEGTSGWTAPEILEPPLGEPRPDARLADVFSLGILIWAVAAGPDAQNPLCGLAGEDYCEALRRGVRPPFPEALLASKEAALASRCWSLAAAARPPLASLLEDLEGLAGAAATGAAAAGG